MHRLVVAVATCQCRNRVLHVHPSLHSVCYSVSYFTVSVSVHTIRPFNRTMEYKLDLLVISLWIKIESLSLILVCFSFCQITDDTPTKKCNDQIFTNLISFFFVSIALRLFIKQKFKRSLFAYFFPFFREKRQRQF